MIATLPARFDHILKNPRQMPIWRDFCVSALPIFFLENWSKKHHIGILIGSCIRGGRYE
jgi:hypothetical protein